MASGENDRCTGGGLLQSFCCVVESGAADVPDRAFIGTGASGGVDTHDETVTRALFHRGMFLRCVGLGNIRGRISISQFIMTTFLGDYRCP